MKKGLAIRLLHYVVAFLLVFLSLSVLTGWHTRNILLIQITPQFAPMQYNGALAFLLSGIAILLMERFKKTTGALGIIVFLIGFLTLLEYIFQIDLRIDQLFMKPYLMMGPYPGRIAPNTAVCFTLTGLAITFLGFQSKNRLLVNVALILALLAGVIGFVALFGYFSGISTTYGWGNLTQMAVHTAVGFILVAVAVVPFIWSESKITRYRNNLFLFILVLTTGLLLFFLFWQALRDHEVKNIQKSLQNEGRFISEKITTLLEKDVRSINRLFTRIRSNAYESTTALESDINNYLSHIPEIELISVNENQSVKIFKNKNITDNSGKNLLIQCNFAFRSSRNVGSDGNLRMVGLPNMLCVQDKLTKSTAVFNMELLMQPLVSSTFLQGYVIRINQKAGTIYEYPKGKESAPEEHFDIQFSVLIFDMQWNVQVWPSEELVHASRSWFPTVFLCFGLIITILSTMIVRFWQRDQLKNRFLKLYSKKLKRSNQALDDFAYIASHDLKEPLRGINNFSSFLLEDYGNKLDEEGKEKLHTLKRLSRHMEALIDSLLNYSRIGRLDLALKSCDINKEIQDKLHLLETYLKEQNAEVKLVRSMPTIVCDQARIGEVFQNLITNAIKYNDNVKKEITINFKEEKDRYIFSVKDNGIGIAREHFDQVFKIFKRLHGRNEYGGGTGAGMTITQKIVDRHRGKMWLESEVGKGTTVYFSISKSLKPITQGDNGHG